MAKRHCSLVLIRLVWRQLGFAFCGKEMRSMARNCELCKKKMGINDSCSLMFFVNQPYQSVIERVAIPGSYGNCLCPDCMQMVNHLFGNNWSGKQALGGTLYGSLPRKTGLYSDNDDVIYAQEYVKNKLNGVTDQNFKSFFVKALSVSQRIIQRRTELSQAKQIVFQKYNDAVDKRNKQKEIIIYEFETILK